MSIDTDITAVKAERPITGRREHLEPDAPPSPSGWSAAVIMVIGGLLTGGLVVTGLGAGTRAGEGYQLEPVAKGEIGAAAQSLVPAQAAGLVEQAKTCRAPLASLMVRATGSPKGLVRFRSGTYQSPNLQLGPQPDRIALPYPAPYTTGYGQIEVESNAEGADVFLSPGVHIGAGRRSTVINVRWDPNVPC